MQIKRLLFLLSTCYIFLYIFPAGLEYVPGLNFLSDIYVRLSRKFVLFFGTEILNIEDLVFQKMTGSGDTKFDYVRILLIAISSLCIAVIASFNTKLNTTKIKVWITIYTRYYVATILIYYGVAKFQNQFAVPDFYTLENTLGDMSPMGLLWVFMGYSYGYTIFTGLVEILAGYLLLFRRTSIFGSLLGITAMVQVWILNMTFDIPVKIASFHYALFCLFIAWPHLRSIYLFFFTNATVAIQNPALQFKNLTWAKAKRWGKGIFIVLFTFTNSSNIYNGLKSKNIEDKSVGFVSEHKKGINIFYEKQNHGIIRWPNSNYGLHKVQLDSVNNEIIIKDWNDTTLSYKVIYEKLSDTTLNLNGEIRGDSINGVYKLKYKKDYLLNRRGFSWVTEFPYNR
jgi:hypothetical protein